MPVSDLVLVVIIAKEGKPILFLGQWNKEETSLLIERLPVSAKVITSFGTAGLNNTMNTFNGK